MNLRIVVCSASEQESRAWARGHGVSPGRFVHAGSARSLEGLCGPFAVVRLASFFTRSDAEEIDAVLRASEVKRPLPVG